VLSILLFFLDHNILATIFLFLGILCLINVVSGVIKNGGYKEWKYAQTMETIMIQAEMENKKWDKCKEAELLEIEAAKIKEEERARIAMFREMEREESQFNYNKRRKESKNYQGLFYPPVGNHEMPTGYSAIPVPSYVAYDLETTGLTPTHDEILEIGAIRIVNGEITGVFHEYIKPKEKIPKRITEINGIASKTVEGCRSIDAVLPDFISFTERLPMVAHNAEFDYSFLRESQLRVSGKSFRRKHYCTMYIYRKYYKEIHCEKPISSRLNNAVLEIMGNEYYNEFIKSNHKALVDASAVQAIFETIGGIINKND